MNPIHNVKEREAGKIPSTSVTNELARAMDGLIPTIESGDRPPPLLDTLLEVWLVWDSGPDAEANKTNHQYWLRRAFVQNNSGMGVDKPQLTEVTSDPKYPDWILATNLAERPPNTGGTETDGPHSLTKGTAVGPVWPESDLVGNVRWVFFAGLGGAEFKLTAAMAGIGYYEGKPAIWKATVNPTLAATTANTLDLAATAAGTAVLMLNKWEIDSGVTSPQLDPTGGGRPQIFRAYPSGILSTEATPRPVWVFMGIPRC